MFTSQVVKDRVGQNYIICLGNQGQLIKPERFHNAQASYQFVSSLRIPFGLWQNIASSNSFFSLQSWQNTNPSLSIEHYAAEALVLGAIEVYKTADVQKLHQQMTKARVTDSTGCSYQFQPASSLLLPNSADKKTIHNEREAAQFIEKLNLSAQVLEELHSTFNLVPSAQSGDTSALKAGLVSGEVAITLVPETHKPQAITEYVDQVTQQPSQAYPEPASVKKSESQNASTRDDETSAAVLELAAEEGTPFCEECEKTKNGKNDKAA